MKQWDQIQLKGNKISNLEHDVTNSSDSSITSHRASAAAAAATAAASTLCIHIKLTSRLLWRHLNYHRTHFTPSLVTVDAAKKKKPNKTKLPSETRTPDPDLAGTETCYRTLFLVYIDRDWYLSILMRKGHFDKNENSTRRRETTRAWPRPSPTESWATGKPRPVEQTPYRMVDLISS